MRRTRDLGLDTGAGARRAVRVMRKRLCEAAKPCGRLGVIRRYTKKASSLHGTNIWPCSSFGAAPWASRRPPCGYVSVQQSQPDSRGSGSGSFFFFFLLSFCLFVFIQFYSRVYLVGLSCLFVSLVRSISLSLSFSLFFFLLPPSSPSLVIRFLGVFLESCASLVSLW